MSYLRWRRLVELAALDHPRLAGWLTPARRKRFDRSPAARWDAMYRSGEYERLKLGDQRHHHRLLASLIVERRPHARILEIGCGEGMFYESMRAFRPGYYLGLDISSLAIEAARARFCDECASGEADFRVADGAEFDTEARFDAVIFADSLEYLGGVEPAMRRYGRLLAPGGIVGTTVWLGMSRIYMWRQLLALGTVLDEALISTPPGGAWLVSVFEPSNSSDPAAMAP